jgi:hypothetical protein
LVAWHRRWYPLPLQSALPPINIPLRPADKDVRLDLNAILDLAYRKGRYRATIDYRVPPDPPLSADDAKWARALLRKARKS